MMFTFMGSFSPIIAFAEIEQYIGMFDKRFWFDTLEKID